jgi:hypothetical protein
MKLSVDKKQLGANPASWLRRAGYTYLPGRGAQPDNFVRRLTRDFYPRFHIYFTTARESGREMITFNLHLDQKQPGYAGQKRHNAEYEGEVAEKEMARLTNLLLPDFFN